MYKIHYKEKDFKDVHPINITYRGAKFIISVGQKVFMINANTDLENINMTSIIDAVKSMKFEDHTIHIKTKMVDDFDIFYKLVRITHIVYSAVEFEHPNMKVNILIHGYCNEKGVTPRSFSIKFRAVDGHPKTRVGKSKDTIASIRQRMKRKK